MEDGADFGSAPKPYAVELDGANGAYHFQTLTTPYLGSQVDYEAADSLPTRLGLEDDNNGISFSNLSPGNNQAYMTVDVGGSPGKIDAWIDFNGDGSWGGPHEQIFFSKDVTLGENLLAFSIPASANSLPTYARIRISTEGGLGFVGEASDGEVEDHLITINPPASPSRYLVDGGSISFDSVANSYVTVDFDQDGDLDYVTTTDQVGISWYENIDGQSFLSHSLIESETNKFSSPIIRDYDRDGDLDILAMNQSSVLSWFEVDNYSVVESHEILSGITSTATLLIQDQDNDGDDDFLHPVSGGVRWYKNNGNGDLELNLIEDSGVFYLSLQSVDFDQDGDLDLVAATRKANRPEIVWYEYDGVSTFSKNVITNEEINSRYGSVRIADLDKDGDQDVVAITPSGSQWDLTWFKNDAEGVFAEHVIRSSVEQTDDIELGDMNGDGYLDIVSSHSFDSPSIYFHDRDLGFVANDNSGKYATMAQEFELRDIDNDGDIDLSKSQYDSRDNLIGVSWYANSFVARMEASDPQLLSETSSEKLTYTFEIEGTTTVPRELAFKVSGIATYGLDYSLQGASSFDGTDGTIVIPAGESSASLELTPIDDEFLELDESVTITLLENLYAIDEVYSVTHFITSDEIGADYGDAPIPYPTSLTNNGAAHNQSSLSPLRFGSLVSYEENGVPSENADSDNDDGVIFDVIQVGQLDASVSVLVQGEGGKLDAWIDFNGDGAWSGPDEQIFDSIELEEGENSLVFSVPSSSISGNTYARFRLSSLGNLGPIGIAGDGEVEDYLISIQPPRDSAGVFSNPVDIEGKAKNIVPTDFDLDGDIDFVYWSTDLSDLAWNERLEDGTYLVHEIESIMRVVDHLEVVDFDNDGNLDILAVHRNFEEFALLLNDGNQSFELALYRDDIGSATLEVIDLDLDGDNDLLFPISDQIIFYENLGDLQFKPRPIAESTTPGRDSRVSDLQVVDFDGDGNLDILSAVNFGTKYVLHQNQGDLVFQNITVSSTAYEPVQVLVEDIDGDGDKDVIGSASTTGDYYSWYENQDGSFVEHVLLDQSGIFSSSVAADIDGDGDTDLVVGMRYSGVVYLLINDGSGQFTTNQIELDASRVNELFAEDFDGDGDLDLLTSLGGNNDVALFTNSIAASLTAPIIQVVEETQDNHYFTVQLSDVVGEATTVRLAISGNAIYGIDYAFDGILSFNAEDNIAVVEIPSSNSKATVNLQIFDNSYFEFDKFIEVSIDDYSATPPAWLDNSLSISIINGEDLADFGDAPEPYLTLMSEFGSAHSAVGPYPEAPRLGDLVTYEANGSHSSDASSDTGDDGVTFGQMRVGQLGASISLDVQGASGYVNAWIDFNGDGSWSGTHEQILSNVPVDSGTHQLNFNIPVDAISGVTYARVRISSDGDLGYAGLAGDGEVEDYAVEILPPARTIGSFLDEKTLISDFYINEYEQMELVDIDNDSDLDVLIGQGYSNLVLLENLGDGSYLEHQTNIPDGAFKLVDIDSDGHLEVIKHIIDYFDNIRYDSRQNIIFAYSPDDQLNFTSKVIYTEDSISGEPIFYPIEYLDFDGNGSLDIFGSLSGDLAMLRTNQTGDYQLEVLYIPSSISNTTDNLIAGDIDSDGDIDFVGMSRYASGSIWLFKNNGNNELEVITISQETYDFGHLVDLDGDGDLDLLVSGGNYYTDEGLRWFRNDNATFSRSIEIESDEIDQFVAADFDGDGDLDIAATSDNYRHDSAWYINQGDGAFDKTVIDSQENDLRALAAGDVDDNGTIDLIAASNYYLSYFTQPLLAELTLSSTQVIELESDAIIASISVGNVVAEDLSVPFTLAGTSIQGMDYTVEGAGSFVGASGTAIIPAGEDHVELIIRPIEDGIKELSETIIITAGQLPVSGLPFNSQVVAATILGDSDYGDYGDAPYPYPVEPIQNGPAHVATGPTLGTTRTTEASGENSDNAAGDNGDDGITFAPIIVGQAQAQVLVTVQNAADGARLDGWIDFNADGSWGGNRERIFSSVEVVEGDNLLTFELPAGMDQGTTYARFRISSTGGLSHVGDATDGEVEDYAVEILPATPGPLYFAENRFEEVSPFGTPQVPIDFDRDGDFDLIYVDRYGDALYLLANDGSGQFVSQSIYSSSFNTIEGLVVEDYDNDGDWDVILTQIGNRWDWEISWIENRGSEGFVTHQIYQNDSNSFGPPRSEPIGIQAGDLNADGKLDFVIPQGPGIFNSHDSSIGLIEVLLSQEDGSFIKSTVSDPLPYVRNVEIVDLDGDGQLDLLTNGKTPNGARIFYNDNLRFTEFVIEDTTTAANWRNTFGNIRAADVDGDGDFDILPTPNYTNPGPLVWYERTDERYVQHFVDKDNHSATDVSYADLDADGDLDLFYHNGSRSDSLFYENRLAGDLDDNGMVDQADYDFWVSHYGDTTGVGMTADMNANGRVDAADFTVWRDALDKPPARMFVAIASASNVRSYADSQLVDLDGDGDLDLVGQYYWYRNVPGVQIHAFDTSLIEAESNAMPITFSLSEPHDENIDITLMVEGLAKPGFDFSIIGANQVSESKFAVSIPKGFTGWTIYLLVIDDSYAELVEDLTISFNDNQHPVFGDVEISTTILSDEIGADFGDAPAPYPTLLDDGGARHSTRSNNDILLGATRGFALDANTSPSADFDLTDDGVNVLPSMVGQNGAEIHVNVQGTDGYLDAWIDFNGDGSWGGPGERIFFRESVSVGTNVFTYNIPASSISGDLIARFRVSSEGGLTTSGIAADGETEDYLITISPPSPAKDSPYVPIVNSTSSSSYDLNLIDIDQDGDIDVLMPSTSSDTIIWQINDSNQNFEVSNLGSTNDPYFDMAIGDFDGDGDIDAVATGYISGGYGRASWFENLDNVRFKKNYFPSPANKPVETSSADLNGDSNQDIIVASNGASELAYYAYENGNFKKTVISDDLPLISSFYSIDIDMDGDIDVVSVSGSAYEIMLHENNGLGIFNSRVLLVGETRTGDIRIADLNGDGSLDIVTASGWDKQLDLYYNDGNLNYIDHVVIATDAGALNQIELHDYDGDGNLDVFAMAYDSLVWYQYQNESSFIGHAILQDFDSYGSFALADINDDGNLNIATVFPGDREFRWFENFDQGDFNRDGLVDTADYDFWKDHYGATTRPGLQADANQDGRVDAADFTTWRDRYAEQTAISETDQESSSNAVASLVDAGSNYTQPASERATFIKQTQVQQDQTQRQQLLIQAHDLALQDELEAEPYEFSFDQDGELDESTDSLELALEELL